MEFCRLIKFPNQLSQGWAKKRARDSEFIRVSAAFGSWRLWFHNHRELKSAKNVNELREHKHQIGRKLRSHFNIDTDSLTQNIKFSYSISELPLYMDYKITELSI